MDPSPTKSRGTSNAAAAILSALSMKLQGPNAASIPLKPLPFAQRLATPTEATQLSPRAKHVTAAPVASLPAAAAANVDPALMPIERNASIERQAEAKPSEMEGIAMQPDQSPMKHEAPTQRRTMNPDATRRSTTPDTCATVMTRPNVPGLLSMAKATQSDGEGSCSSSESSWAGPPSHIRRILSDHSSEKKSSDSKVRRKYAYTRGPNVAQPYAGKEKASCVVCQNWDEEQRQHCPVCLRSGQKDFTQQPANHIDSPPGPNPHAMRRPHSSNMPFVNRHPRVHSDADLSASYAHRHHTQQYHQREWQAPRDYSPNQLNHPHPYPHHPHSHEYAPVQKSFSHNDFRPSMVSHHQERLDYPHPSHPHSQPFARPSDVHRSSIHNEGGACPPGVSISDPTTWDRDMLLAWCLKTTSMVSKSQVDRLLQESLREYPARDRVTRGDSIKPSTSCPNEMYSLHQHSRGCGHQIPKEHMFDGESHHHCRQCAYSQRHIHDTSPVHNPSEVYYEEYNEQYHSHPSSATSASVMSGPTRPIRRNYHIPNEFSSYYEQAPPPYHVKTPYTRYSPRWNGHREPAERPQDYYNRNSSAPDLSSAVTSRGEHVRLERQIRQNQSSQAHRIVSNLTPRSRVGAAATTTTTAAVTTTATAAADVSELHAKPSLNESFVMAPEFQSEAEHKSGGTGKQGSIVKRTRVSGEAEGQKTESPRNQSPKEQWDAGLGPGPGPVQELMTPSVRLATAQKHPGFYGEDENDDSTMDVNDVFGNSSSLNGHRRTDTPRLCFACGHEKKRLCKYLGVEEYICNACNQHWRRNYHTCSICDTMESLGANRELRGSEILNKSKKPSASFISPSTRTVVTSAGSIMPPATAAQPHEAGDTEGVDAHPLTTRGGI